MANTNGNATTHQALAPLAHPQGAMALGSDAFRVSLEPTTLADALTLAEMMASVSYCGVTSPAEALGRIMTGRGLGLSAMQSMRGVYTVHGRPGIDAALMQALCLQSPFCEYFRYVPDESVPGEKATFVTKRRGNPELKHSFTIQQAVQMKLVDRGKDADAKSDNNWNKGPDGMLRARARSELARIEYPDVVFGMYSREELQAGFAAVDGQRDPNEMAGEILSAEEAAIEASKGNVQKAPRNYVAEADALIAQIKSATSRQARAEVRAKFEAWDGRDIEPHGTRVRDAYNASKPAASAESPTGHGTKVDAPNPMPSGNLFTGPEEPKK